MKMLVAENASVRLGRTTIVQGANLTAEAGHVTAIVGPNGSGKTTLLRALTGEIGYAGSIKLHDAEVSALKAHELAAQRAVLAQSTNLSFPFKVYEIVRLGLTSGVQPAGDTKNLIKDALAKVALTGFEGRYYHELSGGEKQRVQMARVLVQVWEPVLEGRPRCLFLDEPIASLDVANQIQILEIARDFADAGGIVLAVLHDLTLTAAYSDQVIVIHHGTPVASGTPEAVFSECLLSGVYACPISVTVAAGMLTVAPKIDTARQRRLSSTSVPSS